MPLAAVNDVTRGWPLGGHLCDAWVSFAVLGFVTLWYNSMFSSV